MQDNLASGYTFTSHWHRVANDCPWLFSQPLHGINLLQSLDPLRLSLSFGPYDVPEEFESLADELS